MSMPQLLGRLFSSTNRPLINSHPTANLLEALEPRLLLSGDGFLPSDIGYVDVTDSAFGAVVNDGLDDTAAIQAAITFALDNAPSRYSAPTMIYLPEGVYDISDQLEAKGSNLSFSDGWLAGFLLRGQNEATTVLRLADNAAGFTSASSPKAVLITGSENPTNSSGGGNQAFRHTISNLTIDVGSGNSGAIGIDFMVHNRGAIEDVTIRTSDPNDAGVSGIELSRATPGPGLINDVTIEGFDYGIRAPSRSVRHEYRECHGEGSADQRDLYRQQSPAYTRADQH